MAQESRYLQVEYLQADLVITSVAHKRCRTLSVLSPGDKREPRHSIYWKHYHFQFNMLILCKMLLSFLCCIVPLINLNQATSYR